MFRIPRLVLFLALILAAACVAGGDGGDGDGEPTPPPAPEPDCHGDALEEGIAISTDMDALRARWDLNKEMLRILFLGEPQ